ncbi:MAG: hypothetical protein JO122_05860 [Acetobacteraceae bacterium]|nr:hypothetical protein [Acetobacteraceae bacterium]
MPIMARRQRLKERQHFGPAELPAQHHLAVFRHPVELKNLLRQVEADIVVSCMVDGTPLSWRTEATTMAHRDAGSGRRPPHQFWTDRAVTPY